MIKVNIDHELRTKLNGLDEELEFYDETGRIVGHFVPDGLYREMFEAYLDRVFPRSEIEEARKQAGGKPLKEIWQDLGRVP